ncbi:MAG: acyl-CoA dehydrogenase family protein [Candidatus Thorarchaeota archaeon]|jgi:alkylation response protein AidB-like acyl-CoA dehydrogenase
MDFSLSEKEQKLWERAKAFTMEHITPHANDLEKRDEFPKEVIQKAYEAGLMNLHIPQEAGGPGLPLFSETLVSEATGYGCAGIATSIMCNNLAFAPLVIGATIEQLKTHIEPLITGKDAKFGAFCLTERNSGSDAASVISRAIRDGDEYVIVLASTQPELKHKGLSLFIVPKSKAVKIGHIEKKMGCKNSVQSEVIFDDARVPKENLVGKEGEGFSLVMKTLDKTRAGVAAIATGIGQRALDEAAKFANLRHQFGKPIGKFQGISFMLADMGARVAASRHLTRHAAWLADRDLPVSKASSIAKFFAGDSAMQNATDAVQIMGGYGYVNEYPVEKLLRDAKLMQIFEGTNQVQRIVTGNTILKEGVNLDTGFHVKHDGRDAPLF